MSQQDAERRFRMYEYMASRKAEPEAPAQQSAEKPAVKEKESLAETTK
jgi:hypothetical protein